MDRPAGSWIEDPATGTLTPNMADEAMSARYPAEPGPPAGEPEPDPEEEE